MAYAKQTWSDNSTGGTPITAARLNHMETGIAQAHNLTGVVKQTLLWTNSNPTADFSGQTISLDLSSYDFVEVHFRQSASMNRRYFAQACSGESSSVIYTATGSNVAAYLYFRAFDVSNTGVVFGSGLSQLTTATARTTNNGLCIPIEIYGINIL